MIRVDAAQLRLADWIRPGDAIVMGQGTAEPLTLTEALVRQRGELGGVRAFLCAMFSDTFNPGAPLLNEPDATRVQALVRLYKLQGALIDLDVPRLASISGLRPAGGSCTSIRKRPCFCATAWLPICHVSIS